MPIEPAPLWRIVTPVLAFTLLSLLGAVPSFPKLRVVWFTSVALVGYGMLQDQITARLCPEYFTIGHPPLPGITHPTLLGIAWGFLGGFPPGVVLGAALALAATGSSWPPLAQRELVRPLLLMLGTIALATLITGASGAYNADVANIRIGAPWDQVIPAARQRWFFIVACAHFGTYLGGICAAVTLCLWVLHRRWRSYRDHLPHSA